jgi:hypothetical protein
LISRSTWLRKGARPHRCFRASMFCRDAASLSAAVTKFFQAAMRALARGLAPRDRKIGTFESRVLTFGTSVQCSRNRDGCSSAFSRTISWQGPIRTTGGEVQQNKENKKENSLAQARFLREM